MESQFILAKAKDEDIAQKAECGGAVSALFKYLLEQDLVDGVLTLTRGDDIYDGLPTLVENPEDLIETCGSLHCAPTMFGDLISKYLNDMRLAVSVKPCDAMAINELEKFVKKYNIPFATTYHARGVISEEDPLCLGMIGHRGTEAANFAGNNCDVLIGLGCRFSERTLSFINKSEIIHVNLDPEVLIGDYKICAPVKEVLIKIKDVDLKIDPKWLTEINHHKKYHPIRTDFNEKPLKPQKAIKEILDASDDSIIVNDAGIHTTYVTLLKKVKKPGSLIFSGGFGPMGYALPASIGVALARSEEKVVVIVGDGGFQMTLQEMGTIAQEKLPILICIINNSSLGIIKQWQDLYYHGRYAVELQNPDFVALAESYYIKATQVESTGTVMKAVRKALNTNEPFLIEILVDKEEGIPLPGVLE